MGGCNLQRFEYKFWKLLVRFFTCEIFRHVLDCDYRLVRLRHMTKLSQSTRFLISLPTMHYNSSLRKNTFKSCHGLVPTYIIEHSSLKQKRNTSLQSSRCSSPTQLPQSSMIGTTESLTKRRSTFLNSKLARRGTASSNGVMIHLIGSPTDT